MPYDISQFSPGYGGTINSSGNVVNIADTLDEATGQFKPPAMKQYTFQSGATAVSDGTVADVSGYTSLRVYVTIGSTSNTVTGQGSDDGITYFTQVPITSSTSGISASGTYIYNVSGFKFFRLRVSTYVSSSVTVTGNATVADYVSPVTTGSFGALDTNSQNGVLLGVGAYNLLYDGTNWTRQGSGSAVSVDNYSGARIGANTLWAWNGSGYDRVKSVNTGQLRTTVYNSSGTELLYVAPASVTDGSALSSGAGTLVSNVNFGFNGANFDRVRVGKVYKWNEYLALPTNTSFTVWTPTSTKKIRLMGLSVSVSASCALNVRVGTAGSGTRIATLRFAGAGNYFIDFDNGFLATNATTDVLEINNPASSPTSATVDVHVTAYGTEE